MKTALITGQDGPYFVLLSKNHIVHGSKRRTSLINSERIDHLRSRSHTINDEIGFSLVGMWYDTLKKISELQSQDLFIKLIITIKCIWRKLINQKIGDIKLMT